MINVRSPAWSSSSGVGGSGRFGGPPDPWVGGALDESSESGPNPGLYENSGLTNKIEKQSKQRKWFNIARERKVQNQKSNEIKWKIENIAIIVDFQLRAFTFLSRSIN